MTNRVEFIDGPLDGESCSYWESPPVLHGPWAGRYDLVHAVESIDADRMRLRLEYRYRSEG